MAWSPALATYLRATSMMEGWAKRRLHDRLAEGKEDGARLHERFGKPKLARPEGRLL